MPFLPSAPQRLRRSLGLATVGVVAGLSLVAAPATADDVPSPTAPPTAFGQEAPSRAAGSTYLSAQQATTSTKRKKLKVSLYSSTDGSLGVALSKGKESHSWTFDMPAKNLKLNNKGAGTLATRAARPYGTIKVKVVPTGAWKVAKCEGVVLSKTRKVAVKGVFVFDSKSPWGKVGKKRFVFKRGSVTRFTGNPTPPDCYGGDYCPSVSTYFGGAYSGTSYLSVNWKKGASTATVSLSRTVDLKGDATRFDYLYGTIPAPAFQTSGTSAQVKLVGKGSFTGTATLASDGGTEFPIECANGKTYTSGSWYPVSYQNGSKKFQAKMSVFGNLSIANGSENGSLGSTTAAQ